MDRNTSCCEEMMRNCNLGKSTELSAFREFKEGSNGCAVLNVATLWTGSGPTLVSSVASASDCYPHLKIMLKNSVLSVLLLTFANAEARLNRAP